MLVATRSALLVLFSLLTIAGILASCVGFMVPLDWQLGTTEALCILICVGFSVDFTVHIAVSYRAAPEDSCQERAARAITEFGVPIAGACSTTCACAAFMALNPGVKMFSQLGIFILWDTLQSLLWSLGFFAPLLAAFGPEDRVVQSGQPERNEVPDPDPDKKATEQVVMPDNSVKEAAEQEVVPHAAV